MSDSDIAQQPLTPASFHILLVLAGGAAHGYAIMQEVSRMTGGTAQLGPGTLYRTIQKLIEDGLIEATGVDADERRVPYRITRSGTAAARSEAGRLAVLLRIAEKRRLVPVAKPMPKRGAHA